MEKRPTKGKYILDENNNVVECFDLFEWAEWMNNNVKRMKVDRTEMADCIISTIFLGLDHNWKDLEKKFQFETAVMMRDVNAGAIIFDRYSTWKEAEEGHQRAIRKYFE